MPISPWFLPVVPGWVDEAPVIPMIEDRNLTVHTYGEEMRIVAFITEPKTIDKIIEHLSRTQASHIRLWIAGHVHFGVAYLAGGKGQFY